MSIYQIQQFDIIRKINETSDIDEVAKLGGQLCDVVVKGLEAKYESVDKKTSIIRKLLRTISVIPDELKRKMWLNKLARDYGLSEKLLSTEMARL